jgi:hypothetical protein
VILGPGDLRKVPRDSIPNKVLDRPARPLFAASERHHPRQSKDPHSVDGRFRLERHATFRAMIPARDLLVPVATEYMLLAAIWVVLHCCTLREIDNNRKRGH